MKLAATFLLALALILSGLARCGMADDREVIGNDAGANLALPGEVLENSNDDNGGIITSACSFQSCPFYDSCVSLFSSSSLATEPTSNKDNLKVYKRNRALLI